MAKGLESLSDLFTKRIFRIPDYQRGYAWKEEQLQDFWDDLQNIFDNRYHYTGLISIKEVNVNEYASPSTVNWMAQEGYSLFHVVDGQQRLTTSVILLNEIINFVKDKCDADKVQPFDETIKKAKEKYICKSSSNADFLRTYLFGYEKDNPSSLYLKHEILGEPNSPQLQETFYTINLKNAKDYFDKQLNDLYENDGLDKVYELFQNLTQNLKFNVHEIENDYDVFVAFETMNNRGKKLSNLELLKNRLIYLTTIYPDKYIDEDQKSWMREKINNAWKEIYFQLGRNKKKPLDDDEYLKAHWLCHYKYTKSSGDDYINYLLDHFNSKNIFSLNGGLPVVEADEIDDYVNSLKNMAQYWYYSFFPDEAQQLSSEEKKWVSCLNRIGLAHFRPLVAVCLMSKNSSINVELFKCIERFIFILFRLGNYYLESFQSNEIYKTAGRIFKAIKKYGSNGTHPKIDEKITVLIEWLKTKIDEAKDAVPENFLNKMESNFKSGKGYYSWKALKYFLYEYESYLRDPGDDPKIIWHEFKRNESGYTTVEHILPQCPNKYYWRNLYRKYSKEEIEILTNSLGNLLPLSQRKNSILQNDIFPKKCNPENNKRTGYAKGSLSEMEVSDCKDWTANDIYDRGIKLLTFLEQRWAIFIDDETKRKLTFVEFVNDGRPDVPEMEKPEEGVPEVSSDSMEARYQFWEWELPFLKEAHGEDRPFYNVGPSRNDWINGYFNIDGIHLYCQIQNNEKRAITGIFINDGTKEKSQKIFDAIYMYRDEIEENIDVKLDWDRNDEYDFKCCTIKAYLNGYNYMHAEDWDEIRDFHVEMTLKFMQYIIDEYREDIENSRK